MNHIDVDQFKKTLSQWLVNYASHPDDVIAHFTASHDNLADPLDRASFQSEMEFSFMKLGRNSLNRNNILRALTKIEKGVYGICEACGEEISVDRLKAIPDTSFCLTCQTEMETSGV